MKEVAAAQRNELRRIDLLPQVQHLVTARMAEDVVKTRAEFRTWRWISFGTAVAATAAVILVVVSLQRPPLRLLGVDSGPVSRSGDLLSPPAGQVQAAVFSDGSRVVVGDRSNARIDAVDADGATVILDNGHLDASIVHRPSTRWQVRAGDYRIRVTGTRFSTNWDHRRKELTVRLYEGSVEVTGPGVASGGARVLAGHVLHANARGATLALADSGEDLPTTAVATTPTTTTVVEPIVEPLAEPVPAPNGNAAPAEAPAAPATAPALPVMGPASRSRRAPAAHSAAPAAALVAPVTAAAAPVTRLSPGNPASWRSLARHAQYREALAQAVGEGFDAQCEQLRADDVVLLGDVARLGGDYRRADQAYRAAMRRFPGLDRPAFSLGVMSFEARHDYRDAASWLTRYLRDHPTGPLATEAAGRLLEAWDLAGETAKAREAARNYLRDHPTGPHRGLAQRLAQP